MEIISKIHHRYLGIELNIQTWHLLSKDKRNDDDNIRMINFAKASLFHWRKSDKYDNINEQRGQWMISHVYAVLGKADEALSFAKQTLKITKKEKLEDFDLAYACESMARAFAVSGDKVESKRWYDKAKSSGKLIQDNEDRKYFLSDLKMGPWFSLETN